MNLNTTFSKKSPGKDVYIQNALVYSHYAFVLEFNAVCAGYHELDFDWAWIQLFSLPNELLNETY